MLPQTCSSLRVCSRYVEHKTWTLGTRSRSEGVSVSALNPSWGRCGEPGTGHMWSTSWVSARTRAVALWVGCSCLVVLLQGPVNTPLQQSSRLKINSRSSFPDTSPLILHMVLRWEQADRVTALMWSFTFSSAVMTTARPPARPAGFNFTDCADF